MLAHESFKQIQCDLLVDERVLVAARQSTVIGLVIL